MNNANAYKNKYLINLNENISIGFIIKNVFPNNVIAKSFQIKFANGNTNKHKKRYTDIKKGWFALITVK